MKIEIMTKEHIPAIAKIEKEAFGAENAEKTLEKELENKISVYLVAKEKDLIIGYIGIWNICGEGDIINIAVKNDFRRKGVGTFLMNEAISYCSENQISALNLEVRESNTSARKFYKKCGFLEVGERKRYYDGKETAVLMRLEIEKTEDSLDENSGN